MSICDGCEVQCVNIFKERRDKMLLYIGLKIKEIGGKDAEEIFFRRAHKHFYGCEPDMRIEVAQYRRGVIKDHVRKYVWHLQAEEEKTTAVN